MNRHYLIFDTTTGEKVAHTMAIGSDEAVAEFKMEGNQNIVADLCKGCETCSGQVKPILG